MTSWRAVGVSGDRYPAWMLELTGKSGVYAIRERGLLGGWVVVYVGESHSGKLRKTITRHLQAWSRSKTSWFAKTFGGGDTDPGRTYSRAGCEIALEISAPGEAVRLQGEWIDRLRPRDNLIVGSVDKSAVPF
jgi:hypothetical protein